MVLNNKKFYLPRLVSQEPYIIWLTFMVHLHKMIISPGVFSILKFWFFGLSGDWKGKKWLKMTKICLLHVIVQEPYISYDLHLWYTSMYKRIISPHIFFIFFKILIFQIVGEVEGQWGVKVTSTTKR